MSAEAALAANRERLMAIRGVVGVGIGIEHGRTVIVVMTERPAAEMRGFLPASVEDTPVVLQETGPIQAC